MLLRALGRYWALATCAACPLQPYPTVEDIQGFIAGFTACPNPYVPATIAPYNLYFNRSAQPEVFANAANGTFSVEIYLPPGVTAFNIRTADYRVFVLPFDALITSDGGFEVPVLVTHAGMSQFVDEATQTVWNFTHPVFTDSSLQFYSQTPGCTCPTCGRNSCPAPQCANEFNLSPYGMWTFQISPEWFAPGVDIESFVFQLKLEYVWNHPPGPHGFVMFDGPDLITPGEWC